MNQPGVKLLQHFDSNKEINDHLETVGPAAAKKYAVDLANNDIQLLPSPTGGFDAVEIPKELGKKAIGPGMKVHRVTMDPKTNQLTVTAQDADPNMTWDNYNVYEGAALNAYNGNQKFQQDLKEGLQRIRTQKSEEFKNYAEGAAATANAGSKNDELAVAYDPNYQNSDGTKGANVVMPRGQARQNNLQHYKADPSTINATVAGFNDVQTKLNQLADVANNPDRMSQVQPGVAAAMLAHGKGIEVVAFGTKIDTSRVNEGLYADDVASANQATKDYVTATIAAHEAITQLPRLQTFGKSNRMTQTQMEAAQNMLPQPGDDPALAQQKMQSLQTTIDPLRKQLPHMQGAELTPTWLEKGQGAQGTKKQTAEPAAIAQPFKGAGAIYNPPKGIVLHGIYDPNSKRINPVPAGGQ